MFFLTSADNISTSSYEESIENMINQIVIYKVENEKQQILNKVEMQKIKEIWIISTSYAI